MKNQQKEIQNKIDLLDDNEKIVILNYILENLDAPDTLIDKEWKKESKSRLKAMRSGKMKVHDYNEVIKRYL
jgi:hypothetical protein